MATRRCITVLFLLVLGAAACRRPAACEEFIRSDRMAGDSAYVFTVDLYDTLGTFDLYFYSAVDMNIFSKKKADTTGGAECLRLDIEWQNPDSLAETETVYIPVAPSSGNRFLYRSGVCPVTPGEHILTVKVSGEPDGFRGLGLVCKKNDD